MLQFGFANISFVEKRVKVSFAPYLSTEVKDKDFETTMRRSNGAVSQRWRSTTNSFARTGLSLISQPNKEVNQALQTKTEALKWMSMDMSSAAKMQKQA